LLLTRRTWFLLCLPLLLVQATAKLSAAEGAGSAAERDALVAEALQGLLAVPQCVNLAEFVPRLAFLRQYKVSRQSFCNPRHLVHDSIAALSIVL
jgi:hypothetical protein